MEKGGKLYNTKTLYHRNIYYHHFKTSVTGFICRTIGIEYYSYEYSSERNSITTSIFRNYVNDTHQKHDSNKYLTEIPKDVVIIESVIFDEIPFLNQKYIISV